MSRRGIVSCWSFCPNSWTAKVERLKKCLCCFNRIAHLRIDNEQGECSNVFCQFINPRPMILNRAAKLQRDVLDDQSRYWGRQGSRRLRGWWRFQTEREDELSRFVELDRPLALPDFRYPAGVNVKRPRNFTRLDPLGLKARQ